MAAISLLRSPLPTSLATSHSRALRRPSSGAGPVGAHITTSGTAVFASGAGSTVMPTPDGTVRPSASNAASGTPGDDVGSAMTRSRSARSSSGDGAPANQFSSEPEEEPLPELPKASDPPPTVARFFAAMQAGASHESELLSLFAEDAVYIEPFSGRLREHRGRAAITAVMRDSLRNPLPEMRVVMDRIDVAEGEVYVEWTCFSPALPGGSGSGVNHFVIQKDPEPKILRLKTELRAAIQP